VLEQIGSDPALLTQVLTYHVVEGIVTAEQAEEMATAPTMEMEAVGSPLMGSELTFTVVDGALLVDGASISTANITASNGIIHIIDSVLVPASVLEALGQ
jgi:uncharacterized surface protein with fasciclin (FAS1) repeats